MAKNRIILLSLVLISIVALILTRDPEGALLEQINTEMKNGNVSVLDADEKAELEYILNSCLIPVFDDRSFSIDKIESGKVSIMSYDSSKNHEFNYGRGNAVYNELCDVIFIDKSLVSIGSLIGTELSSQKSYLTLYTAFLLFHEMGHREIHSKRSNGRYTIKKSTEGYGMEEEADLFAFEQLSYVYENDQFKSFVDSLSFNSSSSFGLNRGDYSGVELLYADFVGILKIMSKIYFIGDTQYDPFYNDESHPTFIQRIQNILNLRVFEEQLSNDLKYHLATVKEWFSRFAHSGELNRLELKCKFPVSAVGVSDGQSIFLGEDYYAIFDENLASLELSNERLNLEQKKIPTPKSISNTLANSFCHVFKDEKNGWLVYDYKQNLVIRLKDDKHFPVPDESSQNIYIPPSPNASMYVQGDSALYVWNEHWKQVDLKRVIEDSESLIMPDSLEYKLTNGFDDKLFFALTSLENRNSFYGYFQLDVSKNKIVMSELYEEGIDIKNEVIRFVELEGDATPVLVDTDNNQRISILKEGKRDKFYQIKLHDHTLRTKAKDLWFNYPSVWGYDLMARKNGKIYVSYIEDSMYEFDVKSSRLNMFFHPSTPIQMIQGERFITIPELYSHTVYIIETGHSDYDALFPTQ